MEQDNYTAVVGTDEVVTGEERQETIDFIEAVMATPCMRYAHQYLVAKGAAPESETDFKVSLLFLVPSTTHAGDRGRCDILGIPIARGRSYPCYGVTSGRCCATLAHETVALDMRNVESRGKHGEIPSEWRSFFFCSLVLRVTVALPFTILK